MRPRIEGESRQAGRIAPRAGERRGRARRSGRTIGTLGVGGIGLVTLLLIAAPAFAGIHTWVAPYSGGTITNSPTTWATGCGSMTWPTAPTASLVTGVAKVDAKATACGGTYGTDNTEAGLFEGPYTCVAPCATGVHVVVFSWTITWTYQMNCTGTGGINNQFGVVGEVDSLANSTISGYAKVQINWLSATCPHTASGGATKQSVTVGLTSQFNTGWSYLFESFLFIEVYVSTTGTGVSEVNVPTATLNSIVLS